MHAATRLLLLLLWPVHAKQNALGRPLAAAAALAAAVAAAEVFFFNCPSTAFGYLERLCLLQFIMVCLLGVVLLRVSY